MNIIELHTGHVFAAGSVKAVDPLTCSHIHAGDFCVKVHGVGFVVEIRDCIDIPPRPPAMPSAEHAEWLKANKEWRDNALAAMEARRQMIVKALLG